MILINEKMIGAWASAKHAAAIVKTLHAAGWPVGYSAGGLVVWKFDSFAHYQEFEQALIDAVNAAAPNAGYVWRVEFPETNAHGRIEKISGPLQLVAFYSNEVYT